MGSIRKLVLESENNRRNFIIISRFLKEMGWWQYWKDYVATGTFKRSQECFNNGNWFDPVDGKIYSVFAWSAFTNYLIVKRHKNVFTALYLFVVFANILYEEELQTKDWHYKPDIWAINYLKRKGLYEKWQVEKELKKSSASA